MQLHYCDICFNKSKSKKGREELARESKRAPDHICVRDALLLCSETHVFYMIDQSPSSLEIKKYKAKQNKPNYS